MKNFYKNLIFEKKSKFFRGVHAHFTLFSKLFPKSVKIYETFKTAGLICIFFLESVIRGVFLIKYVAMFAYLDTVQPGMEIGRKLWQFLDLRIN